MKTLSSLLAQRQSLLRQARLANLAFAFEVLSDFARRVTRAGLHGRVCLKHAAPDAEQYWASLTALEGNQSVIEEHFSDEDLMDLADVVSFVTGNENLDLDFRLEEIGETFVEPLRAELTREGVAFDQSGRPSDAVR